MEAADIDLINQILAQVDWLSVTQPLVAEAIDGGETVVGGLISVPVPGNPPALDIMVLVTDNFPLTEIAFIGRNFLGRPHQMTGGRICLNADLSPDLGPRFELELEKLKAWIQRYIIDQEQDDHYEYPTIKGQHMPFVLFEEDADTFAGIPESGWFKYKVLRHVERGDKFADTWIVTSLDRRKSRWSETFVRSLENEQDGLFILFDQAPLLAGREAVETWKLLLVYMSASQRKFLYDNRTKVTPNPSMNGSFLLLVGYPIVDEGRKEIHWLPIEVPINPFPYKSLKIGPGQWDAEDLGMQIIWGTSENASYQRLFGRGQLTAAITDKKILILGVGAVGSTLFMSLVRGGCRNIDIQDGDVVTPGNITRGQFEVKSYSLNKVEELVPEALRISPYLNISGITTRFTPLIPSSPKFQDERRRLNRYDYIFDCTTDKLLSVSLDKMQLHPPIFNISLTNGATHLAWITGYGNIHLLKSAFYSRFEEPESKTMFVAQGCWHPTFKATNVDVQILLNLALKEFLRMLDAEGNASSFYIERGGGDTSTIEYQIKKDV